jgi:propanol-preferring alcohol dehydrogenase
MPANDTLEVTLSATPVRCYQLIAFKSPLALTETFAPVPTGTEVVLRVLGAGVCHSDVHLWEGFHDLGGGRKSEFSNRITMPLTMGHETTGQVFAVGPDAEGVSPGDACLVCPWIGCGVCPECSSDNEHLCTAPHFRGVNRDGGYADFIMVPHPRYLIPLGDLDPVAAAPIACSGLTAFGALKKLQPITSAQPIVVIGAGGLGLMSLGLLKILGGKGAVVVELDERKRDAALQSGALAAIDPRQPDAQDRIRAAVGTPVMGVIDFVGSEQTTALAFDLLAKGGKMIVVGLFGGAMSVPIPMLASKAVTIQGSYIGPLSELRELVAILREKGLPTMPIARRPLVQATDAINALRQGEVLGRTVLVP